MRYLRVLAWTAPPEKVSHGREGYFFGVNDEFSAREGLQPVADALFALKRISSPELAKYSFDDIAKYYTSALPAFGVYGGQVRALATWCHRGTLLIGLFT